MGLAPNNYATEGYLDIEINMASEWMKLLLPEFDKAYMKKLYSALEEIAFRDNKVILPCSVYSYPFFRALELTDYDNVKVVILGQDPYPTFGHANGLAFAVNEDVTLPGSLRNIFKEIGTSLGSEPADRTLVSWAKQGVLLLNTVLSVEEGTPASHRGLGWERFTDKIISLLNDREEPVVFLLWGKHAQEKESLITNDRHRILKAAHPSPLSAHNGFFGCGHFKEVDFINWID